MEGYTISNQIVCDSCHKHKTNMVSAIAGGVYYAHICRGCLCGYNEDVSSNAAGYERRRGYEDNAQDTIQPYDANGPNPEFARLYPRQAAKVFSPETLEKLKRKI